MFCSGEWRSNSKQMVCDRLSTKQSSKIFSAVREVCFELEVLHDFFFFLRRCPLPKPEQGENVIMVTTPWLKVPL